MSEPREIILGPGQEVVVRGASSDLLTALLDQIVDEGHGDLLIQHWPGPMWEAEEKWQCHSRLTARWNGGDHETWRQWQFDVHAGETRGATPVEAAQARLDQIRLGKSLTWLAFAAPEPS